MLNYTTDSTDSVGSTDRFPPLFWSSGPLGFRDAVLVWAAAAGVAGAYVPAAARDIALHSPELVEDCEVLYNRAMAMALAESTAEGSRIEPRGVCKWKDLSPDILDWITSVATRLVLDPIDHLWHVEIWGVHHERMHAAKRQIAALGAQ